MPDKINAAVFGLGAMGYGMAASLLCAGHKIHGIDLMADAVARFRAEGSIEDEIDGIAGTLDTVVVVVLNAVQTESMLIGEDGVVPKLRAGAVVMACATVLPDFARDMAARCGEHGVHYLDAPISGGAGKAASGQLSVMASGMDEAFSAARPVLDATTETVFGHGDTAGPGSAMKGVNQFLAGVHIAAMAEALTFGMTQAVSPKSFVEVISKCAGTGWMPENRAPHIVAVDYTPLSQINIWPKDLDIVLDIAKSAGFFAPITVAALQQYMVAVGISLGREDATAIAKVYARNISLSLPGET